MMPFRVRYSPWPFMVIGLGALAIVNTALSTVEVDISPLVVEPAGSSPVTAPPDSGAVVGDFKISHSLARPLFSSTRREFTPQPKTPPPQPEKQAEEPRPPEQIARPALILQGTRIVGQASSALVLLPGAQTAEWLQAGSQLEGWAVTDVRQETLVLVRGGEKAIYSLYGDGKGTERDTSHEASAGTAHQP